MSAIRPADELVTLSAGLDALDAPVETPRKRGWAASVLPPIIALAVMVSVWAIVVRLGVVPSYVLPGPLEVLGSFLDSLRAGEVQAAVANSIKRAAVGFGISLVLGSILGLMLARLTWLRRAIGPLVTGLMVLPSVAWVPAAILWFGISNKAMLFVIVLGAAPSIANGLLNGIAHVPPLFERAGRVLGATGLTAVRFVVLPAALPGYLGGLRQGWAFAWRSLMAAELIAYSPTLGLGLGQLLDQARELSDMSMVITSIIMILIVGILIELCVFAPLERRVLRNRGLLDAAR